MYKDIPEDKQEAFAKKVANIQPSGYKYPTTKNEYWNTVDSYWPQLLGLFVAFAPPYLPRNESGEMEPTHILAEGYRRNRDIKLINMFNKTWASAPDTGTIHLLAGWNVLCDLCSESYLVMDDEMEDIATEEQKQKAASVAIDSYDKIGTYMDEIERQLMK